MSLLSILGYRRKKPPAPHIRLAYQSVVERFIRWCTPIVKQWETQPKQRRQWQLIGCLSALLLLSAFSVYVTATGHLFTRIPHKSHEPRRK